ncbi:MAG: ArsR family transcriptional regulator, partial [Promethearchaeota archaeon]
MNSNIWTEISNPIRMELLFILFNKKATISELKAKIGDISHSEVSRHIGRLAKQDLITKEAIPGRNYELTNLGKMIVKLIKPLDFILENSEFFKSHRIDDVPEALLQGLQDLSTSKIVHGTGNLL